MNGEYNTLAYGKNHFKNFTLLTRVIYCFFLKVNVVNYLKEADLQFHGKNFSVNTMY